MPRISYGTLLIAVGALCVALAAGTIAYADWAEQEHAAIAPTGPVEDLPSRVESASALATATLAATPWPTPAASPPTLPTRPPRPTIEPTYQVTGAASSGIVAPSATPTPAPTTPPSPTEPPPTETPTPAPTFDPAVWITIPKLKLSVDIMDVGVQGGEYVVPAWNVGHHEDSVQAGDPGNAVFTGHLETINAGHVFAHLKDLVPGDAIYTYTKTQRLTWTVRETKPVANTDTDFFAPTDDTRITLYTCTGVWNPIERDYTQRLVVVGDLVSVDDRTDHPGVQPGNR